MAILLHFPKKIKKQIMGLYNPQIQKEVENEEKNNNGKNLCK